ncbi:hypothetical protein EJF36_05895 [Bacillus sp. HMF5848]|uniref:DUF5305 family protein n=1 Tax=Bacillus sp. HMF5848 TaxID=2495421 RepID=UPI000F786D15|nr:DUF5305 family protein [Bacillus sp. HMF5848]RSK26426.1 hypothetical protein EJF36_05895 [Bacillus sp. HMF5848]
MKLLKNLEWTRALQGRKYFDLKEYSMRANTKEPNINKNQMPIKKWALFVIIPILIVSCFVTIKAFMTPTEVTETILENVIKEETNFAYEAEVKRSLLYPEGGTIDPGEHIIKNITKSIPVSINSQVFAEEPVEVAGNYQLNMSITAEGLWKKDFTLEEPVAFNKSSNEVNIINKTYNVDVEKIVSFIEAVEKEIKIGVGSYIIEIKPILDGKIIYKDQTYELNKESVLKFDYSKEQFSLIKDTELEFYNEYAVENTKNIVNELVIFNITLPISGTRIVGLILTLLCVAAMIVVMKDKIANAVKTPEQEKIDKKHKSRIVEIHPSTDLNQFQRIALTAFKQVIQIADDKELPVHKQITSVGETQYFVIDNNLLYFYKVGKGVS